MNDGRRIGPLRRVALEPSAQRVVAPPAARDVAAGEVRVEIERLAEAQGVVAVAGPVFQARHLFGSEPAAAAELQEMRLLAGAIAADLLGVADIRDLLGGEAKALGDLPIGEAHRLTLALDLREIERAHRVAHPLL